MAPPEHNPYANGQADPPPENGYMVIGSGSSRRWVARVAYALLFLLVAGVLVVLFVKLETTWSLAIALVGFMVSYMLVIGYVASRNAERKE